MAASFRLGFPFRQASLEIVVRNSFTAVELLDTVANFCVDGFAVLLKPAILPGRRAGLLGRLRRLNASAQEGLYQAVRASLLK